METWEVKRISVHFVFTRMHLKWEMAFNFPLCDCGVVVVVRKWKVPFTTPFTALGKWCVFVFCLARCRLCVGLEPAKRLMDYFISLPTTLFPFGECVLHAAAIALKPVSARSVYQSGFSWFPSTFLEQHVRSTTLYNIVQKQKWKMPASASVADEWALGTSFYGSFVFAKEQRRRCDAERFTFADRIFYCLTLFFIKRWNAIVPVNGGILSIEFDGSICVAFLCCRIVG